jgi:hypothetical protein
MKQKKSWSAVAASALVVLSLAYPAASSADSNPVVVPSQDPFKASMEQYRIERENFNAAIKARAIQMRTINSAFKSACDKATSDFKNSMAAAKGPEQKSAAVAQRKSAIAAAIIARDSAIAALGPEPTPPIEPAKPLKAEKRKSR